MTRVRRGRRGAAVALICAATAAGSASPATALNPGTGTPGYCPDGRGVTVVVDLQALGGSPLVRCYPGTAPATGLEALKGAGFQVSGVRRWGEAFICRIEGRPSSTETLALTGNPSYRETCIDTPPALAYWSYWHAGNNCRWQYSQWGVKNRTVTQGGFEGWSFSLNATATTNPVPRVAPSRPGTAGRACGAPEAAPGGAATPPAATDRSAPTNPAPNGTVPDNSVLDDGVPNRGAAPTRATAPLAGSTQRPAVPGGGAAPGSAAAERTPASLGASSGASSTASSTAVTGLPTTPAGSGGPSSSNEQPSPAATFSDGSDLPNLAAAEQPGSSAAPWAAAGLIVALSTAASIMARRRRSTRPR